MRWDEFEVVSGSDGVQPVEGVLRCEGRVGRATFGVLALLGRMPVATATATAVVVEGSQGG